MNGPAMVCEDHVWVVIGMESGVRSIGMTAVDAWRNFFDHTAATMSDLSQALDHEDFRCIACRLVPDDDAAWRSAMANTATCVADGDEE